MTCKQVEQYWEEWLSGTPVAALENHLRSCGRCREQAAALARSAHWVRLLRQEAPEASPYFWTGLEARLKQNEVASEFWTALGWVAARAALALAVVVLLLGAVVLGGPGEEPAEPTVAGYEAAPLYVEESEVVVPAAPRRLDRDQVVVTLVGYAEAQQ